MSQHPFVQPPEGLMCKASWEDITLDDGTYCEYQTVPSGTWHPASFSADTIRHLRDTQFQKYLDNVEAAAKDCAAAVRRLVSSGPPIYIYDAIGLPVPDGDTHISMLWFSDTNEESSAKLKGSFEGSERDNLWKSQKETLAAMEAAESAAA